MNQEQATAAAAQLPHIVTYTHAVAGLRSSRSRSPPAVRAVGRGLAATLDAPAGGRAARAGRERVGTDHFAAGASNEGDCEFDRQMAQAKSETASTSRRNAGRRENLRGIPTSFEVRFKNGNVPERTRT